MAKKTKFKDKTNQPSLPKDSIKDPMGFWGWTWGILAILVSVVISWKAQSPTIDLRWMLLDGMIPILGLFYLLQRWLFKQEEVSYSPITGAVLSYFLVYLICQATPVNRVALLTEFRHVISLFLVYLIALQTLKTPRDWKVVFHFLLAGGVLASGYALIQKIGMDPIPWEMGGDRGNISSFLGNSNLFGWYLAALIPLALGMLSANPSSKKEKIWLWVSIGFLWVALIIAQNRAGWVAFLVSTGIYGVLFLRMKSRFEGASFYPAKTLGFIHRIYTVRKILLGISVVLVFLMGVMFWNHYTKKSDIPIKGRFLHWKTSALMVKENPFLGIGPGNYGNHYLIYQARVLGNPANASFMRISREIQSINAEYAHNEYIQSLCDTGILGFAFFSFLISVILVIGFQGVKRTASLDRTLLILGCYCGVISILVSGLFGFPFHVPVTGMLFWLLTASIAGLMRLDISKDRPFQKGAIPYVSGIFKSRGAVIIGIVLLAGYSLWAVPSALNTYRASLWVREGRFWAEKEGNVEEAVHSLQKAVTLAPDYGLAHYYLGGYYARSQQNEQALKEYAKALENYNDVHIFFNMGQIYFSNKQYDRAEEYYKKALFLNDTMYNCYKQLGLIAATRNQMELALGYFRKYLEFDKSGPESERFKLIVDELQKEVPGSQNPVP